MTLIQAIILGIVQGLTEFIPVSSSGHLIIVPQLLGFGPHPLVFDTTVHLGTALALLVFFSRDLLKIIKDKNIRLLVSLFIGTLPAIMLGVLFEDVFSSVFRNLGWVVVFLTLGSLLMYLADKLAKFKSNAVTHKKALYIGLFQTLALLPGFSRSGSTISGSLFLGLDRVSAARFSFLLSIPVVLGAGLYKLFTTSGVVLAGLEWQLFFGFVSSFAAGLFAIRFMMKFLESKGLMPFVIYRVLLAFVLVFYL